MVQTTFPLIRGDTRLPEQATESRLPIGPKNPNDTVVKGWDPQPNPGQRTIRTVKD